jgi:N-acetylglutamate synthase-like GNAT family acetyltransferase
MEVLTQIQVNGQAYRLRLARESDIAELRLLVNAAYKELGDMGLNYTATYQDEEVTRQRISRGRAFVIENNGELLGTVLFTAKNYFTGCRSAYVSQLAVTPRLKHAGLGTVLMNLCEKLASDENFEAVQLDTAKPAQHLVDWYLKRGYKIVGDTRWDGKTYESWIFEKVLIPKN